MSDTVCNKAVIMHIIASNFFGGPEKQILNHCSTMNAHKWKMIICSFLEGKSCNELLDISRKMGIETNIIKTRNAYNPIVLFELYKLIKKQNPNIIVAHGYRSLILCLILKVLHKRPVIGYSRGFTSENMKIKLFERVYRVLLRFSDQVLAVSYGHKNDLKEQGLNQKKIEVIHNAVSVTELIRDKNLQRRQIVCRRLKIPDSTLVVTAGRLSPEKGHRFLIEAISRMKDRIRDTSFLFCGDGVCKEELEHLARKLNVIDHCYFVGFRRDLDEIYHVMDFMVLPSLTEGLPNVILEAFAHQKPVVATMVGGVSEVVEDGKSGILVPPGRPDLLSTGIEKLISSRALRIRMGTYGYRKIITQFTFEIQNKKLEKIYNGVMNCY